MPVLIYVTTEFEPLNTHIDEIHLLFLLLAVVSKITFIWIFKMSIGQPLSIFNPSPLPPLFSNFLPPNNCLCQILKWNHHCVLFSRPCVFITAWADGPFLYFQLVAVWKQAAHHVHVQNSIQGCGYNALRRWFLESDVRLPHVFTYDLLISSQMYVMWLPVVCIGMRDVWMLGFSI